MQEQGVIQPLVLVKKRDGSHRFCVETDAYHLTETGRTEQFLLTGEFHVPTGSALTKLTRADTVSPTLLRKPKRALINHKYATNVNYDA